MVVPSTVTPADVQNSINRWNLSVTNWKAGIFSPTNVVPGGNTNFLDLYTFTNQLSLVGDQLQISQAQGFNNPYDGFISALQSAGKQSGSTCARVVLQIDQDAVLTRDAFRATLKLENSSVAPLTGLKVKLVVQNALGQDVTSLFASKPP